MALKGGSSCDPLTAFEHFVVTAIGIGLVGVGALIGSTFGPIGAAVGAVIGLILGFIFDLFGDDPVVRSELDQFSTCRSSSGSTGSPRSEPASAGDGQRRREPVRRHADRVRRTAEVDGPRAAFEADGTF